MWSDTQYLPDCEQIEIASAVAGSLKSLLPIARFHGSEEETESVWASLQEIGVFEIALSEGQGGSGLGLIEEVLVSAELGCSVVAPSVLATITAMPLLNSGACEVPRVALGFEKSGQVTLVSDAKADLLLVSSETGIEVFHYPETIKPLDDQHWNAQLSSVAVSALSSVEMQQTNIGFLRFRLLSAAMLAGLAQAATDMAVDYAGMREQFGRPIGSFQAIKHHCANMALATRSAQDQMKFAAVALEQGRPDAEFQVESAYFVSAKAAVESAAKNIQIHGGIGYSSESDPHIVLKRAKLLSTLSGGLEASIERLGVLELSL